MRFHIVAYPAVDIDFGWKLAVGYSSPELPGIPSSPLSNLGA